MAINLEASFASVTFQSTEAPTTSANIVPQVGAAVVGAPFAFSNAGAATYYFWTLTSVPGGSALGQPEALPDSGGTDPVDMTANEGLWHFEGGATDSSGNARNGTVTGATLVTGKVGTQAYQFGTTDYIDFGAASTFLTASDDFTLAFWMKGDAAWTPAGFDGICGFSNGTLWNEGAGIYWTGPTTIRAFVDSYNVDFVEATISSVSDWNHVVMTYTGGALKLYVNGQAQARRDVNLSLTGLANTLALGRTGIRGNLEATIDEFAIWSRGLSDQEVWAVYGLGEGARTTPTYTVTPDVVGTYNVRLDVRGSNLGVEDSDFDTAALSATTNGGQYLVGQAISRNQYLVGGFARLYVPKTP
jgi:hypothetical protein